MKPYREQIDEILECFDFVTVAHIMQFPLFPEYGDFGEIVDRHPWSMFLKGKFGVPTVSELMHFAEDLLLQVSKRSEEEASYVHCGCFKATNWYGRLALEFVVKEWTCEED